MLILRFLLTLALAWCAGQLVSKLKLPAILGWLIAGMALGPHGLALMSDAVLDAGWYNTLVHLLECAVGLMIGTELVGSKLRRSGRSILITTLTQSMGTFAVVSLGVRAGVCLAGDSRLSGLCVRRHRPGHCSSARPLHCAGV